MVKITKNNENEVCFCCSSKYDLYNVTLGKDERRTHTIILCPDCRKQLSNMLTKRVK